MLGVASADIEIEPTPLAEMPPVAFDIDELVGEAVASRPDLRALKLALAAACERSRLARYDYLNIGGTLPDINGTGRKGFEARPGLRMTLPIFHQNQGAIARAEAEVQRLRRQYRKLRDSVLVEVRQAHTRLLVSFRQACVNRLEGCGIVGCQGRTLWRAADEYQKDARPSCPVGWCSAVGSSSFATAKRRR